MSDPEEPSEDDASRIERALAKSLLSILGTMEIGDHIHDSPLFQDALSGLEYFLKEIHSEWDDEWLDGVLSFESRKTDERTARVFGLCILMSDQNLAPLLVDLRVNALGTQVEWLECRLGARGRNGMSRTPYGSVEKAMKQLYMLEDKETQIDWAYKVTFGEKVL